MLGHVFVSVDEFPKHNLLHTCSPQERRLTFHTFFAPCYRRNHSDDVHGDVAYDRNVGCTSKSIQRPCGTAYPTGVHISEFQGKSNLHPRRNHVVTAMLFLEIWTTLHISCISYGCSTWTLKRVRRDSRTPLTVCSFHAIFSRDWQ